MKKWLEILLLTGCLLVLGGTVLPRIYASIGMILLVLPVFFLHPVALLIKKYLRSGYAWSIGLLFLLPFISGVYSSNLVEWWKVCQIKVPLLLLPLAAIGWPAIPVRYVKAIQAFFIMCLFAACCWSIAEYQAHAAEIADGYLRAKVIPVLMGDNHICFSYMVVAGVLFLIVTWPKTQWQQWLHVAGIVFFTIFLHLLAAKTGLVFLYGSMLVMGLHRLFTQRRKWVAAAVILAVVALPFIAIRLFPTFKNRVQYIVYDFSNVLQGKYEVGSNDGNRMVSLMAGYDIAKTNPIPGVGYGDVKPAVDAWYATHRPQTPADEKILPSNNWLLMWCGIGVATFVIMGLVFFYLFKSNPYKAGISWYLLCGMAFLSTLYENPFETQYGVYVFLVPFFIWQKIVFPAREKENIA